eukprot:scaffold115210_cov54-Phaeocystis_antarctica.AAC.3
MPCGFSSAGISSPAASLGEAALPVTLPRRPLPLALASSPTAALVTAFLALDAPAEALDEIVVRCSCAAG